MQRTGRDSRVHSWGRYGLLLALAGSHWCGAANAAESTPLSIYIEAGRAFLQHSDTEAATVGLRLPMQRSFWDGRITGAWDLYLSEWKADAFAGQRTHYTQVGVVPMFRYRFDEGQSPWFVEGGIGVSYLNEPYRTPDKEFSTQWNFGDYIGVGFSFGAEHRQDVGLYVKHVSNAGLREPNPGETFMQLRCGYAF